MHSQEEIAEHLDISTRKLRDLLTRYNLNHKTSTLDEIRVRYIRDLREKAAGRRDQEAQGTLDQARFRDLMASAQIKEMTLFKEQKLILDREQVREAMDAWVIQTKSEYESSIEKILAMIESQSGNPIERDPINRIVDSTCRVIADFNIESADSD
jgi:hypothetical protein